MRSPACFALVLALLAASCGGNVVVDSGSTGTGVSCVASCEAVSAACPAKGSQDCATQCPKLDAAFDTVCPDAYHAYLTCAASNAAMLCGTTPTACVAEMTAFEACYNQVCTSPMTGPMTCP
jgi:hypothetical protein